jgi:FemAB family protein
MTNKNNTFPISYNFSGYLEKFQSAGLVVLMRENNRDVWDKTLNSCNYIPVAYTNMNIEFLLEHQHGNGIEIYDLSCIILWDNRPAAIWPLFLSIVNGKENLNFLDDHVLPPLIIKTCASSSAKSMIKSCFDFAEKIMLEGAEPFWTSMESFNGHLGLSFWHEQAMGMGAACSLNHEVFLDLSLSMIEIKSQFRKSYKSLINSGQKLWSVGILEDENPKIWNEFLELHLKVAGRKTRSYETWNIHYNDICEKHSFLIYLRNHDNEMVGAGLFHTTRDEGLYSVGAYDRTLFDKPLGHVVQYKAIEELKKRNIKWYKLGARPYLTHTPLPSEKEVSIGEFKHGFASHLFPRIILTHSV